MESFSHLGNFSSVKKAMSQQREDGNLTNEAINYIENWTYASDCPVNRKRSIRKKASKLAMREEEVYYKKKPGQVYIISLISFSLLSYNKL